jgi:hypothetical protein
VSYARGQTPYGLSGWDWVLLFLAACLLWPIVSVALAQWFMFFWEMLWES